MKNKILSGSNWCLANYSLHLAVDRIGCLQDNIPKSHRRVRFACNNKIIIYDNAYNQYRYIIVSSRKMLLTTHQRRRGKMKVITSLFQPFF